MISGIIIIKKSIKENNIDLLVLCDNLAKIIGGIAAKISRTKVIAYSRDTFVENFIGKVLRFFTLNFSDKVIAVSDKTANFFKTDHGKGKVITIHNGVEISKFNKDTTVSLRKELKIENNKIVIGCIAVFLTYKGHIYLLRAIKQLQSLGIKDLTCLLIGKGELEDKLKLLVNEEKIDDVRFLGFREDIPDLLKTMDILVIPSISVEGFPRVAIEAMAMSLPVIGTTVGGIPEAIDDGKTGIIVPPGDVASLSKAIKYLFENPDIRVGMGEAGRKKVEERFNIDRNVKETEKVFLEVLEA
jgi:glycosyltransferase involved in cell wall biosynthesis